MPVPLGDAVAYSPESVDDEVAAVGESQQAVALADTARSAFRVLDGASLEALIAGQPSVLLAVAEDGRGPLWWAWEGRNVAALQLLARFGFDLLSEETDARGVAPWTLGGADWRVLAEDARRLAAAEESKTVYFVRHGFSESQEAERKHKGLRHDPRFRDAGLHADGVAQAACLQPVASEWGVEAVLCSPLRRAFHTAAVAFGPGSQGSSWWSKIVQEPVPPALELSAHLREHPLDRPENIGLPPQEWRRWLRGIAAAEPEGLAELSGAAKKLWDPEVEWAVLEQYAVPQMRPAAQHVLRELQDTVIRQLPGFFGHLLERREKVLAVVSHYGSINRLLQAVLGVRPNLGNCAAVRLRLARTASGWLFGPLEPCTVRT